MTSGDYDITENGSQPDFRLSEERINDAADRMFGGNLGDFDPQPQLVRPRGSEADIQAYAYSAIVDRVSRTTSEGLLGMFSTAQLNPDGRQAMTDLSHLFHFEWSAWACNRKGMKRAMQEALDELTGVEQNDDDDDDEAEDPFEEAYGLAEDLYEARNTLGTLQNADAYAAAQAGVEMAYQAAQQLPEKERAAFSLLAEIDHIERSILLDRQAGLPVDRYDWTEVKDLLSQGATPYQVYHLMPPIWQHMDSLQKGSISDGRYHATIISNILPRPGATILPPPDLPGEYSKSSRPVRNNKPKPDPETQQPDE